MATTDVWAIIDAEREKMDTPVRIGMAMKVINNTEFNVYDMDNQTIVVTVIIRSGTTVIVHDVDTTGDSDKILNVTVSGADNIHSMLPWNAVRPI